MNPNIIPHVVVILVISMLVAIAAITLLAVNMQRAAPIIRNRSKGELPKGALWAWILSIVSAFAGPLMPVLASIAIVVAALQWRGAIKNEQPQIALAKLAILNSSFLLLSGFAILAWTLWLAAEF
jgi:hypothetical protein